MRPSRFRALTGAVVLVLSGMTSGCRQDEPDAAADPEPGIALTLAEARARSIQNVRYRLSFDIPARASDPASGRATIRFTSKETTRPLVLDFAPGADHLTSVTVGGRRSRFRTANGHIIVPASDLSAGDNTIEIAFQAGDAALNRNPEFLYTLFVPARAHLTFPCFDQPDLKARFTLELTVPSGWQAVANGAEASREIRGKAASVPGAAMPRTRPTTARRPPRISPNPYALASLHQSSCSEIMRDLLCGEPWEAEPADV